MSLVMEGGTLPNGLIVAGIVHDDFVLRVAVLADTYRAVEAVAIPPDVATSDAVRVAYEIAVDDATILCQLTQLGTLDPVPSPAALMDELDPDDMVVLRQAADRLKKKLRQTKLDLKTAAAPNSSSSEPGLT